MRVRPVPLHALVLVSSVFDTITTRTGADGRLTLSLAPGNYVLSSAAAIEFEEQRFRWKLPITISANAPLAVALTNDNAERERVVPSRGAAASVRVEMAGELFARLKDSVFRIDAGLAHGTGFLIDSLGGVILTNAHVVESAEPSNLAVGIDASTRVRAQLLARDSEADIAIIRVHPRFMAGRTRIPLQNPVDGPPVVPGERLVAIGFPLHQELTLTSGIASSVRAGAIISDVNINPGNSGGPLLNVDGEAVAVNTFADRNASGPGVSGSILVSRAGPALAQAAAELQRAESISDELLPVVPSERLNIATLKAYADTVDFDLYRGFSDISVGGFAVTLQTPAQTFVSLKAFENEIAKDRKKREAKAGLSDEERYSEVREYRDWCEYVGAPTTPVVVLSIIPKIGETGGSVFARMMISSNLRATYKFQGDVAGAKVFRNGFPIEAVVGGHTPTKVLMENQWISLKDVADQGLYVYDAELLRPDSNGVAPSILVVVQDLKNPKTLKCRALPAEVVARAWNDFEEFYRGARPSVRYWRADERASRTNKPKWVNESLTKECGGYIY